MRSRVPACRSRAVAEIRAEAAMMVEEAEDRMTDAMEEAESAKAGAWQGQRAAAARQCQPRCDLHRCPPHIFLFLLVCALPVRLPACCLPARLPARLSACLPACLPACPPAAYPPACSPARRKDGAPLLFSHAPDAAPRFPALPLPCFLSPFPPFMSP